MSEDKTKMICPIMERAQLLAKLLNLKDTDIVYIKTLFAKVDDRKLKAITRKILEKKLDEADEDLGEILLDSVKKILLGRCKDELWDIMVSISYTVLKKGVDLFTLEVILAAVVNELRKAAAREEEIQALARRTLWSLVMINEGYRILTQKTIYEGLGINKALFQRLLEKYADEALEALTRADLET